MAPYAHKDQHSFKYDKLEISPNYHLVKASFEKDSTNQIIYTHDPLSF